MYEIEKQMIGIILRKTFTVISHSSESYLVMFSPQCLFIFVHICDDINFIYVIKYNIIQYFIRFNSLTSMPNNQQYFTI